MELSLRSSPKFRLWSPRVWARRSCTSEKADLNASRYPRTSVLVSYQRQMTARLQVVSFSMNLRTHAYLLFRPRTILVTFDRSSSSPPILRMANIMIELCLSAILSATPLSLVLTITVPVELRGMKRDN